MNLAKGAGSPFEEVCSGVTAAEIITAQLRGFQRRLEIANKNIATEQDTLELTATRAKARLATELDVSRAAAQVESCGSPKFHQLEGH
jgi:hypothetical protein